MMLCIIQARMSSTRLPGKSIKTISKIPLLEIIYKRLKKSKMINKIVIATSTDKSDDAIIGLCKKKKFNFYRGSLDNVLKRFLNCVEVNKKNSFIRITGDSPLVDYKLIDKIAKKFNKKKVDLATNVFPRTYPKGLSVEIVRLDTIKKIINHKTSKKNREHITSYIYDNPKKFKIINIKNENNYSKINLSVDNLYDLLKLRRFVKVSKKSIYSINSNTIIEKFYEKNRYN